MDNTPIIWCATETKTTDNLCTKSRCNISRLWVWITSQWYIIIKFICIYALFFLHFQVLVIISLHSIFFYQKLTVCLSTWYSSLRSKCSSCISAGCNLVMGHRISEAWVLVVCCRISVICVLVMGCRISAACVLVVCHRISARCDLVRGRRISVAPVLVVCRRISMMCSCHGLQNFCSLFSSHGLQNFCDLCSCRGLQNFCGSCSSHRLQSFCGLCSSHRLQNFCGLFSSHGQQNFCDLCVTLLCSGLLVVWTLLKG